MGRPVVHWELWSENPEALSEFYRQVFDWQIQHIPDLDYRMVETGDETGIKGGIMKPEAGPWPGNMALYVDVDDLDSYAARIRKAGGEMVVEKMPVPGIGHLSLFKDPDGRVLGMWQRDVAEGGTPGREE
jgi:predicted enzyme related to lactoylglutathione lyase